MKNNLLLFILFSFSIYGQNNPTRFPYGVQITGGQPIITTPVYLTTTDNTGLQGKNLTVLTDIMNKSYLSTGLKKNGIITINVDPTKYNISAGIGVRSNFNDPENPTSRIITFSGITGKVPAYLNTGNITYIAIEEIGTSGIGQIFEQSTPFTSSQRRDLIILGAVIHSNLATINVVNNISAPTNADTNQLHDLMEAVGALNISGNKYSANGANLSLNKSAGSIFKFGINFATDWKKPHEMSQVAGTSLTFRYRTQNGTEGSDVTVINPALYDLNNILTAVPNNKFSIQTVTMFQTGITRIQYGQAFYDDLATAKNAIFTRSFAVEGNILANGVTRAYIIVKNTTTSLQNTSDAEIIEAQKFGGVASGGVTLTYANIVSALGYTPENVANKNVANGYAPLDGTVKVPTSNLNQSTETQIGVVELATAAETTTGTDNTRSVTPLGLANATNIVHTTGTETITGSKNFSSPPTINSFSIWHNGNSGGNLYSWSASVYSSNSAANSDSFIFKNTSQVGRWVMLGKNSETGSNIGYDFVLSSRDDTGSFLSDCLFIKRSNGNIGIGNNSANLGKLQVSGNIAVDSGNEIRLYKTDNSDWATIKSDATTANLNLNSVIKIQNAAGVNSMFPMDNGTTDLGTASLQYRDIYITGLIKGASIPLKYTALISQSGTSAPTAIVLDNTLGGTVVWTRNSTGVYFGTLSGAFTVNKSIANIDMPNGTGNPITRLQWVFGSTSVLQISSKNSSETLTDGILSSAVIKIEVYP
jgi:hypothetical protein